MDARPCLHMFITLFAPVNPLEGVPFFLAKTGGETDAGRARIALRAATAVTIILLVSAVTGAHVLTMFGISLPAFQAGGGIILFLIAVQMTLIGVSTEKTAADSKDHSTSADIAVVPLAIPLLGGPGAISGAILYGTRMDSIAKLSLLCVMILIVGVAIFVSLRTAGKLRRALGDNGINIATRLMGLLIAGMAIELTVEGILKLVRA
jgi:multiple antibiotic resistance protein